MRKKEGGIPGITVFSVVMITVVVLWNWILTQFYYGYLGYKMLFAYALCVSIYSLIHNIHYDRFRSIYNPFFLLCLSIGFKVTRIICGKLGCPIGLVNGIQLLEWFDKESLYHEIVSPTRFVLRFPFMLLSFVPYYIFFKNIRKIIKDRKEDCV